MIIPEKAIFNFNTNSNISDWVIVDDVVMGGASSGNFKLNNSGNGMFCGSISLKNNGGFSSVRYRGESINTKGFSKIILKVKGDGKRYQFRVKEDTSHRHSYVSYFTTSGDWDTIEVALKDLFPKFRGRALDIPNFSKNTIEELGFLFGNKTTESFKLLIDRIYLR